MDVGIEMDGELREELRLPKYVVTKEDALKWFLGRAAEARPEEYYGAYYLLGQHFLSLDCQQAEYFLKLYVEIGTDVDALAQKLLSRISEDGDCRGARNLLVPAKEGLGQG